MKKMELLAPAGDLEKLKIAVIYGADAVYFGGEFFSLRAGAGNLTIDEIKEGVAFAHEHGAKAYMTLNIFAHNEDIEPLCAYLSKIKDIPIDAFIISDPGVIMLVREMIPDAEVHLSTQANMTNYVTAKFWEAQGVKRIVIARELTFSEIRKLRSEMPESMELEAFVHGAMCISYSGRCLSFQFYDRARCQPRYVCASVPLEVYAYGRKAAGRIFSDRGRRARYIHPEFARSVHDRAYSRACRVRYSVG